MTLIKDIILNCFSNYNSIIFAPGVKGKKEDPCNKANENL